MYLLFSTFILLFMILVGMFFGAYVEHTTGIYCTQGNSIVALLGAVVTPMVTIVAAYLALRQWQYQNFLPISYKIIEAQEKYYKSSQELVAEYKELPKKEQEQIDTLESFDERRRFIISIYLSNSESLALYLKHKMIPESISKDFFGAAIINSLDKVLEKYIIEEQEKDPSYYENYVALVKKWRKGESNG